MSKIFRRPMFRKGGNVGEGIMTGIVDRDNYEIGGSATERLMKVMQDNPVQSVDPVAELLISAGLRGFSETGGGSTFGNLAKAFEDPTQQYFKRVGEQGKSKRDLALAGAQLDIEQDYAKDIAKIKATNESGYQKDYTSDRQRYELYSKYTDPNKKGYFKSVEQDFPGAMADFGSYIQESIRQRGDEVIGIVPHRKSGKSYDWSFDEMVPGAKYFKPDTKKLYERDPKNNILIEFDPYTGEKLKEYKLGG